jgi:uncharacterized membrane protein
MKSIFSKQTPEQNIGIIVKILVTIAAGLTLAGGSVFLLGNGHAVPDYSFFKGTPQNLQSITGIINSAISLNPFGIIQFCVLIMIATPVLRVSIFLISFFLKKDYLYVAISSIVLLILLFSFLYGSN